MVAMNLAAVALACYQADMHLAKSVRHACIDCADLAGICARHAGNCLGCGSSAIVARDAHLYADAVHAYWCASCCGEPDEGVDYIDDRRDIR